MKIIVELGVVSLKLLLVAAAVPAVIFVLLSVMFILCIEELEEKNF